MHAADGAVVLVEAVEEGAHAVVPHLDHPAVEAGEDPWPPRVEAQALHPVALRLELGQHLPSCPYQLVVSSSPATAAAPGPRRGEGRSGGEESVDLMGEGRRGEEKMAMGGEEEGALDLGEGGDLGFGRGGGC